MRRLLVLGATTALVAWTPALPGGAARAAQPPVATPAPPAPPAPAAPAPASASPDVLDYIARAVARTALVDLRVTQQLGVADYIAAAELLEIARSLAPDDQEILRFLIEAEMQAGRGDRVDVLTRDLLRLDPADTVAQLSLITARVLRLQSADERLVALEGLLGPRGEGLDPSVRSRLALDAALLLRERADAKGFAARVREAIRLDPTNRDAASLLVALVQAGDDAPASRLESLIVLLNADPIDAETHVTIASELAAAGALKSALRFCDNADALTLAFTKERTAGVAATRALVEWRLEGPRKPLELVEALLVKPRRALRSALDARVKEGVDVSQYGAPEDIRLPPQVERVWIMAAAADGDAALRDLGLAEQDRSIAQAEVNLSDPERRASLGEDRARAELGALQGDGVWLRLLIGEQVERAEALLTALRASAGSDGEEGLRRLDAWLGLRKATPETLPAFEEELERLAPTDPLADLGVAVAMALRSEKAGAAERFARLAVALSGSIEGAFAEGQFKALTGKAAPVPDEAAELTAMASGVPKWIDEITREPRRFMQLTATLTVESVRPTDRVGLRVRLRNTSPIPLALGSEKTMNSRLLLSAETDVGSRPIRSGLAEIASLERRFRLMPREELTVTLWPDAGYSPWFTELYAGELIRQRWRVVQGFRLTAAGAPDAGPMSLSTETGGLIRRPFSGTTAEIATLANRLPGSHGQALIDALGALRYRLFRDELTLKILTPEEARSVVDALVATYTAADPLERLLMLAHLPNGMFIKRLAAFDAAVAGMDEADERVGVFKVVSRGAEPGDAVLAAAAASGNARVREAAATMIRRLVPQVKTYSRIGSGAAPPQTEGAAIESGAQNATDLRAPKPGSPEPGAVPAPTDGAPPVPPASDPPAGAPPAAPPKAR
ncbi:MAG: hypothetical protein ACKVS8_14705 [Phycisphaerales bacterium]